MERVRADYGQKVDFIYLFANKDVHGFYEKLGYERIYEKEYYMDSWDFKTEAGSLRKLDDLETFEDFALNRRPLNKEEEVKNFNLDMFYYLIVFGDKTYYIEELDLLVVMEEEDGILHIYDILSKTEFNMEKLLGYLLGRTSREIIFYFKPEGLKNLKRRDLIDEDNALFLWGNRDLLEQIKLPATKQA